MFREVFPQYLAMGMTYEEFWDKDPALAIYYRKAEEIKNDKINQQLWLQGLYIYEALCDVSPILRAFGKKGTKPHKYSEQPYVLNEKAKKNEEQTQEQKTYNKGLDRMKAFARANNKRFETEIEKKEEVSEIADRDR